MFKRKKSQAWGMDLVIGVVIFSIGVSLFFLYAINNPGEAKENIETLFYEGEIVFESILSEGYPEDWNSSNVAEIGILRNDKINETKLSRFYDLAQADYDKTKSLLNTDYDYYFFLEETIIIAGYPPIDGIGKPGADRTNIDGKNLVKITRFAVYDEKPVTAYLYIWEE